jgi:hypothetical protein
MATLPYKPASDVTFIGREGAVLPKFRTAVAGEDQNSVNLLEDEDLLKQISIAREIEAQRGLKPFEAERLANLLAVQKGRTAQASDMSQQGIDKLFGGQTGGGSPSYSAPAFDLNAYEKDLQGNAAAQRAAQDSIFNSQRTSGVQQLNDIFGAQRGQTIDEQGALGSRLLSGAGQRSVADVDAQKNKSIADFITSQSGKEGEARLGIETGLQNNLLAGKQFGYDTNLKNSSLGLGYADLGLREKMGRAGLLQSGSQFGETLGLEKEKFAEGRRQGALDQLFQRETMEQAERLGRAQADAAEPSILDQVTGVVGGIGSLAGGVGGLMGGMGALKAGNALSKSMAPKKTQPVGGPLRSGTTFNPYSSVWG